jgi:hypothetical protein
MVEARPWCVPAWGEVAARSTEEVGGPRREGLWARAGGADAREGGGRTHAGPAESTNRFFFSTSYFLVVEINITIHI